MKTIKASTLLRKAREFLSGRGRWIKGQARVRSSKTRRTIKACAVGACWEVSDLCRGRCDTDPFHFLHEALGGSHLAHFNDDPKTSKKDVLALFRKAERLARKEGQ